MITVPPNLLPKDSNVLGGSNDNPAPPSEPALLMAAAQMHKLGRLRKPTKSEDQQ